MYYYPKKITFLLTIAQLIILILFVFAYLEKPTDVVYCVDNQKLFDEFHMTKETKKVGEKKFNQLKKKSDSLYMLLQNKNLNPNLKDNIYKQFVASRENLDLFNQKFANSEVSKIWNRISTYTKEFCEINNYTILIGKEHQKDVLYIDKKRDLTNELLIYINSRYAGKE